MKSLSVKLNVNINIQEMKALVFLILPVNAYVYIRKMCPKFSSSFTALTLTDVFTLNMNKFFFLSLIQFSQHFREGAKNLSLVFNRLKFHEDGNFQNKAEISSDKNESF